MPVEPRKRQVVAVQPFTSMDAWLMMRVVVVRVAKFLRLWSLKSH